MRDHNSRLAAHAHSLKGHPIEAQGAGAAVSEECMKHIVGFSGGIDSQACARWVLNRFPVEDVILLNSDAGGNEHCAV